MTIETKTLDISKLVEDLTLWPRGTIDKEHVKMLTDALRRDDVTFPPITVSKKGLVIVDGVHRVRAYKMSDIYQVKCEVKSYSSDEELYLDAVRMNSAHGRKLMPYDQVRIVKRADELGIPVSEIASALNITLEKVETIKMTKYAEHNAEIIPLRGTVAHLVGKDLTDTQLAGVEKTGGWRQGWYIDQVINLLKHDLVNWENDNTVRKLEELYELLRNTLIH